jgi:hypothetical protein
VGFVANRNADGLFQPQCFLKKRAPFVPAETVASAVQIDLEGFILASFTRRMNSARDMTSGSGGAPSRPS